MSVGWLQRARDMVPVLASRAKKAEELRMVPAETVQEMQEAGFFRVLQPKRYGGYEMDPQVFYDVGMTLAEGCMSTEIGLGSGRDRGVQSVLLSVVRVALKTKNK